MDGEVNRRKRGAEAKATVRNAQARGTSWAREESSVRYPKPVDLCLGRSKPFERRVEDRPDVDVQITRLTWA